MIEGVKDEEEDVRFHRHDQFQFYYDYIRVPTMWVFF